MADWIGNPYKVKQTITIELEDNNDKNKALELIEKEFNVKPKFNGEIVIVCYSEGRYYEGDYYEPCEYDDDLFFDEIDVSYLLTISGINVVNKKADYEYDWGENDLRS